LLLSEVVTANAHPFIEVQAVNLQNSQVPIIRIITFGRGNVHSLSHLPHGSFASQTNLSFLGLCYLFYRFTFASVASNMKLASLPFEGKRGPLSPHAILLKPIQDLQLVYNSFTTCQHTYISTRL
jgi:hypothetical protein